MNSVLIIVDSKDRVSYSPSTSDFVLNFQNNPILNRVHSFFVKSVSVPNVEYNIHGTYQFEPANNLLYIETSGGGLQAVITVPVGQYSLAQLITVLQNSATGVAVGLTIVQDPNTGKLTFNSTAPGGIKIYARGDPAISPLNSTLAPNLGILSTNAAFSSSIVAAGLPSLQGNQNIYVSSVKLSGGGTSLIDSRINNLQSITTVPCDVPFGEVIHYETSEYEKDYIKAAGYLNLRELDIKLYNDYGEILNLQGEPFTMIIKAFYDP
jgi:hypothetical protein